MQFYSCQGTKCFGSCLSLLEEKQPVHRPTKQRVSTLCFPFPVTIIINQVFVFFRILELRQFGLLQHWEKQFLSPPESCSYDYIKKPNRPRISLTDIGGAFVLLIGGLSLAILVFLIEKIVYYHKLNRSITSNIAEKPKQEAVKKKIRGNKAVNKNKMALF